MQGTLQANISHPTPAVSANPSRRDRAVAREMSSSLWRKKKARTVINAGCPVQGLAARKLWCSLMPWCVCVWCEQPFVLLPAQESLHGQARACLKSSVSFRDLLRANYGVRYCHDVSAFGVNSPLSCCRCRDICMARQGRALKQYFIQGLAALQNCCAATQKKRCAGRSLVGSWVSHALRHVRCTRVGRKKASRHVICITACEMRHGTWDACEMHHGMWDASQHVRCMWDASRHMRCMWDASRHVRCMWDASRHVRCITACEMHVRCTRVGRKKAHTKHKHTHKNTRTQGTRGFA